MTASSFGRPVRRVMLACGTNYSPRIHGYVGDDCSATCIGAGSGYCPAGGAPLVFSAPFGRFHPATATALGNPELNSVGQFDATGVLQSLSRTSATGTGFTVPHELPFHLGGQQVLTGDSWSYLPWCRDTDGGGLSAANLSDMLDGYIPLIAAPQGSGWVPGR